MLQADKTMVICTCVFVKIMVMLLRIERRKSGHILTFPHISSIVNS